MTIVRPFLVRVAGRGVVLVVNNSDRVKSAEEEKKHKRHTQKKRGGIESTDTKINNLLVNPDDMNNITVIILS